METFLIIGTPVLIGSALTDKTLRLNQKVINTNDMNKFYYLKAKNDNILSVLANWSAPFSCVSICVTTF
ncbi:MAG: hypothetical protein RBR94_02360 [Bacilli bacterium]|jgi:hypothetical protein|nr:hypothetical protein [Bacilli bacterium]